MTFPHSGCFLTVLSSYKVSYPLERLPVHHRVKSKTQKTTNTSTPMTNLESHLSQSIYLNTHHLGKTSPFLFLMCISQKSFKMACSNKIHSYSVLTNRLLCPLVSLFKQLRCHPSFPSPKQISCL